MELSGVDKIQTVSKLQIKEAVKALRIEDTLTISAEAQKKAEWVNQLKQMPDIRSEKLEALSTDLSSPAILAEVARKIETSL